MTALCEIVPSAAEPTKAKLRFTLHPGQSEAFESKKRFVLVLAGTQSGKTVLGPLWLRKEIQERGPGDYLVVTPIFDDLHGLLDELLSYSRELDEAGTATEKIDNPHDFHGADALRYIVSHLQVDKPKATYSGTVVARPGMRIH